MKFKKFFIYSLIFLSLDTFIANAQRWPKSESQVQYDIALAKNKIIYMAKSNLRLSKKICEKIILDQRNLHDKYDNFFDNASIYQNPDFIKEKRLWAENYDNMGFPGFSELAETLYKNNIDNIIEANAYIQHIYRVLSLIL